ncbi:small predicted membrane protein [Escherichia coli]|uniref:Small predicted membrane protein n=2 Tax=Escherichia coli TaxID=562 RepID=A0A376TZU1_ECOLX|nr:small predicted membrane protein [Escherichia coli]
MLESIINLVSSGAVDSHTPQTAVAAVLCAAMIGCLVEFQIADEVLFVHAGCGVNALSGLQKQYFQQVL